MRAQPRRAPITPQTPGTYAVCARLAGRIGPVRLPLFRPATTWRIHVR
ncbi:MAG: hypothetical protein VW450_04780 [Chloroflexota bacterium]